MQKMIFAFITAAAAVMLISPLFIPMLRRLKYGQVERAEGPHAHSAKEGTPTMGGIMFIIAIIIAVAAFSIYGIAFDFSVPAVLIMLAFGLVGFLDDFIKVKRKRNLGLRAYQKIIAQLLLSFAAAYYAYKSSFIGSTLYDPIFGSIELGGWYIPFTMFMIIAVVNSANLTDGLDGLLSGVSLIYSIAMGVLFLYFAKVFDSSFINEPRFVANRDGMLCMSVFAFALPRLFEEQQLSRKSLYGRYRLNGTGRRNVRNGHLQPFPVSLPADGRMHCCLRRKRCAAGQLVQTAPRQAHIQNGTSSSPF